MAVVKYLVQQGADKEKPDISGATALFAAAQMGHLSVVQCLVRHGADHSKATSNDVTPLMIAVHSGHLTVAVYLRELAGLGRSQESTR